MKTNPNHKTKSKNVTKIKCTFYEGTVHEHEHNKKKTTDENTNMINMYIVIYYSIKIHDYQNH